MTSDQSTQPPAATRTLSRIRHQGWTSDLLQRAARGAVAVGRASTTDLAPDDRALAEDLLRWIEAIADKESHLDDDDERDDFARQYMRPLLTALNRNVGCLPRVAPAFEGVLDILAEPETSWAPRLRATYADPVRVLIDLIDGLGVDSLRDLHDEHRHVLLALGTLGTVDATRSLLGWLRWHEDTRCRCADRPPMAERCLGACRGDGFAPLRDALGRVPRLHDHGVALWPELDVFPRHVLLETLAGHAISFEPMFQLILRWLDEDPQNGADALASYRVADPRALVPMAVAYKRSRDAGDADAIEAITYALADLFGIDAETGRVVDVSAPLGSS